MTEWVSCTNDSQQLTIYDGVQNVQLLLYRPNYPISVDDENQNCIHSRALEFQQHYNDGDD